MSKIKIFSMGGLNENGKNTYIVEVDNKIFILDAGLKYATDSMYGIDYILPNYDYLEKNKKRIVGVFLTHAHPENMGGVIDLARTIPEIKIFCTKYTKKYLELEGLDSKRITEIAPHKKISFRDVSIFPITVTHSVPDAVMYVINTKDGAICYTGDFIIDPSMGDYYHMDLGKVAYIGKQGVLCLLSESVFSEVSGHTQSLTNQSILDIAAQDEDMVAEAILAHVSKDKNSELYQLFAQENNIGDDTSREQILGQIKASLRNRTGLVSKLNPADYNQEFSAVVQRHVEDGSFRVSAWDLNV